MTYTQRINCYPVDKYQGNQLHYPVVRKIHLFNNWDQGWSLLEAKVYSLPVNCSFFAQQESVWLKCLLLPGPGAYSFYLHLRRLECLTICECQEKWKNSSVTCKAQVLKQILDSVRQNLATWKSFKFLQSSAPSIVCYRQHQEGCLSTVHAESQLYSNYTF